jgi:hypothetical protein
MDFPYKATLLARTVARLVPFSVDVFTSYLHLGHYPGLIVTALLLAQGSHLVRGRDITGGIVIYLQTCLYLDGVRSYYYLCKLLKS